MAALPSKTKRFALWTVWVYPRASEIRADSVGARCAAKLVKLLFKQLVAEFCNGGAPSAEEVAVDGNGVPFWLTGKALSARLEKSTAWLSQLKKKLGEAFADAIAKLDPDGYRWKWH